jgi:hypothetical protein
MSLAPFSGVLIYQNFRKAIVNCDAKLADVLCAFVCRFWQNQVRSELGRRKRGQRAGSWRAERVGVLGILPINDQVEVFGMVTINNMHFEGASKDTVSPGGVRMCRHWGISTALASAPPLPR